MKSWSAAGCLKQQCSSSNDGQCDTVGYDPPSRQRYRSYTLLSDEAIPSCCCVTSGSMCVSCLLAANDSTQEETTQLQHHHLVAAS